MPGLTFADALDAALGTERSHAPVPPPVAPFTSRHANPFLFSTATAQRAMDGYARVWQPRAEPAAAAPRTVPPQPAPRPATPRPARVLTDAQRRELESLQRCGAALASDFTVAELRHEYRKLARRFHPDSHPGCSASAAESLSREFSTVTASYQRLLASIEPRH